MISTCSFTSLYTCFVFFIPEIASLHQDVDSSPSPELGLSRLIPYRRSLGYLSHPNSALRSDDQLSISVKDPRMQGLLKATGL